MSGIRRQCCASRRESSRIFPSLNVLVNNAGIMELDMWPGPVDEEMLVSTVTTNLGGPIRMSGRWSGTSRSKARP